MPWEAQAKALQAKGRLALHEGLQFDHVQTQAAKRDAEEQARVEAAQEAAWARDGQWVVRAYQTKRAKCFL